jgi:glutathione synthase
MVMRACLAFVLACQQRGSSLGRLPAATLRGRRWLQAATSTPDAGAPAPAPAPDVQRLLTQANAWCGLHGLMYTDGDRTWTMAPVALVPNEYPRTCFSYAQDVQPIINVLIDAIARDRDFLLAHLLTVAAADPFTQRLVDLYTALPAAVVTDAVHLGLHRSDYMLDHDPSTGTERPLQVSPMRASHLQVVRFV